MGASESRSPVENSVIFVSFFGETIKKEHPKSIVIWRLEKFQFPRVPEYRKDGGIQVEVCGLNLEGRALIIT